VLRTEERQFEGEPVDISFGSILFRTEPLPPVDTTGRLKLKVDGFDEDIVADVRVIRTHRNFGAAIFIVPPTSFVRCMARLTRRDHEEKSA
jgi:hypothetical protein